MHALHDKHHITSSFLKSQQNMHNSVKYKVNMKMTLCGAYSERALNLVILHFWKSGMKKKGSFAL